MSEEETTPEELEETNEEKAEEEQCEKKVPPDLAHHPIDIGADNLNTLQNQAFLASTGQHTAHSKHSDSHYDVQSGDELLITLTLASPVGPTEPSYIVDIEYEAFQKGMKKASGIFLYRQTTVATFTPGLPNNGNLIQQFSLQTIKFDLQHTLDGPADIAIHLLKGGQPVGKAGTGKFRIHP